MVGQHYARGAHRHFAARPPHLFGRLIMQINEPALSSSLASEEMSTKRTEGGGGQTPGHPLNIFATVGRVFLAFLGLTGRLAIFTADAVSHCVRPPIFWGSILRQLLVIGYFSLPVVGL